MHLHHSHHGHEHSSAPQTPEERVALLNYMLEHNKSHAAELHDVAHSLENDTALAAQQLHEAIRFFEQGNERLAQALELLRQEV